MFKLFFLEEINIYTFFFFSEQGCEGKKFTDGVVNGAQWKPVRSEWKIAL